jgi:hypothetical protein
MPGRGTGGVITGWWSTGSCAGRVLAARGGTCLVSTGNWKTVYNRHRRWSLDGTWEKILGRLQAGCDEAEGKDWTLSADSTVVRAHQHAAGARRALPAELIPRGRRRMTRFRWPGRAGRPWAVPAAG